MKKDCESIEQLLIDDLDDALNHQERAALADHLAICPDCRSSQEKLKKATAAATILRHQRESVTMPVNLPVTIKAGLVSRKPLFSRRVWRFATMMTMIVLLIAVAFVYQNVILGGKAAYSAIPVTDAALSGNTAERASGLTNDTGILDTGKSAAQAAQSVLTMATTRAATKAAAATTAAGMPTPPFVLYSGSMADLKPLREAIIPDTQNTTTSEAFRAALPEALADASLLRILTNSGESIQQVVFLAGYSEPKALAAITQLRATVKPEDHTVTLDLIYPVNHSRLIDLFGPSLYNQLLPSVTERQLTYLLIMIGG